MSDFSTLESAIRLAMERSYAKGTAEGELIGEAHALLLVLAARNVATPEDVRERIFACSHRTTLERWIERAAVASKIDDVIGT